MPPSTGAAISELLVAELELEPAVAQAVVSEAPSDVGSWKDSVTALELCRQLETSGAAARAGKRIVRTPRLPPRDVILEDAGPEPLQVMRVLRAQLPIALRDAKQLVANAPSELARALDGNRAERFRRDLTAVGARVRLV